MGSAHWAPILFFPWIGDPDPDPLFILLCNPIPDPPFITRSFTDPALDPKFITRSRS